MLPENPVVPMFCDGEQHQLFPGIDLNYIEACGDQTCPSDCCDKDSCCEDEECVQSCDLLCDGYVGCVDHPPDCDTTHCASPVCDGASPPCFDETCFVSVAEVVPDIIQVVTTKKRKINNAYEPDLFRGDGLQRQTHTFMPPGSNHSIPTNRHQDVCCHDENCPAGCIDPQHLHARPYHQHAGPQNPYSAAPSSQSISNGGMDGAQYSNYESTREASIASTPYLTHSESRPSTACSMAVDFTESFFSDKPCQCLCVDINGVTCGQHFPDSGSLNQHILDLHISKTSRGNDTTENFYCSWADCSRHLNNQPFTSIGKVESHYLSHSNYKGWRCDICGRIYAREGSLDRHRQTHLHEKMYQCHTCGKNFTDKNQMKIHLRSHTGEKPYKCNFPGCDHRASDSTNMTKHKKTHLPRTHFCPYPGCSRTFVRSDGLKRHMKTCKAGKDFEEAMDQSAAHLYNDGHDMGSEMRLGIVQ